MDVIHLDFFFFFFFFFFSGLTVGARWNRSRWVEAVLADICSVCLGLEIGGLGIPLQTPVFG